MEEADVLGDRIAIMARGMMRALGTSVRLKQRFGSGYQLTVLLRQQGTHSCSQVGSARPAAAPAPSEAADALNMLQCAASAVRELVMTHLGGRLEPIEQGVCTLR
jgi:ABC-type multidrug transport system ATPase subunit